MKKGFVIAAVAVAVVTVSGVLAVRVDAGADRNVLVGYDGNKSLDPGFKVEKPASVGIPAPDFKLEGVVGTDSGKEFKTLMLKDYNGKWLVLFFYPADFTFVCPTEIKGFNDNIDSFRKLNAEIVAVSTDSKWSHLAWIKRGDLGDLKYPLLADFNKEAARAYGVLDPEKGVALRGLFIIDPQGVMQYQVIHNLDVGRSVEETLRVLEALQSGGLCPLGWKPGQKTLGK